MSDVVKLYEIVPVGDGSHCICKNELGEHYRERKEYTTKEQLVFNTKATAQEYIKKYLDADYYIPEAFGYSVEHLPCAIITVV